MTILKQVYFIVNANAVVGFGHLSRCLLLASEFRERGIESTFLSYEVVGTENISTQVFQHKQYASLVTLLDDLYSFIDHGNIVIVDTDDNQLYQLDFQEKVLATGAKMMHITMKNNMTFKSHFVLNQNIIGLDFVYNIEPYTKKMIGPAYFVLSDAFQAIKKNPQRKEVKNVLITCGNTDPNDITLKILDFLMTIGPNSLVFNIVVGGGNNSIESIRQHPFCTKNSERVMVFHDTKEMYAIMRKNDIAISTVGLTYWELTLHNIPCMLISGSEREKNQISYFTRNGYAHYLGDYDDSNWIEKWTENFNKFDRETIKVEELNEIVNVKGKTVIADNILKTFK